MITLRVGDWVLVCFPHDKSGRWRKLSQPWLLQVRPRRNVSKCVPPRPPVLGMPLSSRVPCWRKRRWPGRPPRWVDRLLQSCSTVHKLSNCPKHMDRDECSQQPTKDACLDGHETEVSDQQQSPEGSLAASNVAAMGDDNDRDWCDTVEGSVTPGVQHAHPVSPSQQCDLVGVGDTPESSTTREVTCTVRTWRQNTGDWARGAETGWASAVTYQVT